MDKEKIYRNHALQRLMAKAVKQPNGCLEWQGVRHHRGYGLIRWKGKSVLVHRLRYMLKYGVELGRLDFVCHTCDNPACLADDHLFLGTPRDNMQDCISKGRRAVKYRPHIRHRVHSDEVIQAIRDDTGTLAQLSTKYGVSMGYISKIRNNKAKHCIMQSNS